MVTVSQRAWRSVRLFGGQASHWPRQWIALVVAGLLIWVGVLGFLLAQPTLDRTALRGVFVGESPDAAFRWTSSQVSIPLAARAGPTILDLTLAAGMWPGRAPIAATLTSPGIPGVVLPLVDRPRHIIVLLPAQADTATLDVRADPGPSGDRRYLGVRLYGARAQASGLPFRALLMASGVTLLVVLLGFGLRWCAARGWLLIGLATLIGLGLRVWALDILPPGFFQDEAVSAVDAWNLLQTGRDHLGHLLPLGAFKSFGDWVSPLLTYTQLPFIALFGPGPLGARLAAALAGTLAIPAAYAVMCELRCERPTAALVGLVVAISPWQILRSRVASPPALVPLCWLLVLWTGLRLIRLGRRQDALWLALAAGLGLYSYPTMKLTVPLLAAGAVALACWAGSAGPAGAVMGLKARLQAIGLLLGRWWWAGVALGVLWLPFVQLTLFNTNSAMRASRKILRADSVMDWLAQWSDGYTSYLRPDLYFLSGDPSNGSSQGVQLTLELPLLALGLVALVWLAFGWRKAERMQPLQYWLVVLAAVLAPLPASLMAPNPHLTRALIIAPIYAVVVGLGACPVRAVRRNTTNPLAAGWTGAIGSVGARNCAPGYATLRCLP